MRPFEKLSIREKLRAKLDQRATAVKSQEKPPAQHEGQKEEEAREPKIKHSGASQTMPAVATTAATGIMVNTVAGSETFHPPSTLLGPPEMILHPTSCLESISIEHAEGIAAKYKKGLDFLQEKELADNPDFQFELGESYEFGYGYNQDFRKALSAYKKAADKGHRPAAYKVAYLLFNHLVMKLEQNDAEVFKYLVMAKDTVCEARELLAICYTKGIGTPKDLKTALEIYKSFSSEDYLGPVTCTRVAKLYRFGYGIEIEKDLNKALSFYENAIAVDSTDSVLHLNRAECLIEISRGAAEKKESFDKAWTFLLSELKHPRAAFLVANFYEKGVEPHLKKNTKTALKIFESHNLQKDWRAIRSLAFIYARGSDDVSPDIEKSNEYISQLMRLEHAKSNLLKKVLKGNNFAFMMLYSYFLKNNLPEAHKLYDSFPNRFEPEIMKQIICLQRSEFEKVVAQHKVELEKLKEQQKLEIHHLNTAFGEVKANSEKAQRVSRDLIKEKDLDYANRLQSKEGELKEFKNKIHALNSKLLEMDILKEKEATLRRENLEKTREISDLSEKLSSSQKVFSGVERDLNQKLLKQSARSERLSRSLERERRSQQDTNSKMQSMKDEMAKASDDFEKRREELQKANHRLDEQIRELREASEKAKSQVIIATNLSEEQRIQMGRLEKELKTLQEQWSSEKEKTKEFEKDLAFEKEKTRDFERKLILEQEKTRGLEKKVISEQGKRLILEKKLLAEKNKSESLLREIKKLSPKTWEFIPFYPIYANPPQLVAGYEPVAPIHSMGGNVPVLFQYPAGHFDGTFGVADPRYFADHQNGNAVPDTATALSNVVTTAALAENHNAFMPAGATTAAKGLSTNRNQRIVHRHHQ